MSLVRVPDVQGPICPARSHMSSAMVPDVFGLVPDVQGPRCLGPICPATLYDVSKPRLSVHSTGSIAK